MRKEKIEKTIEELKDLFANLELHASHDIRRDGLEDMSVLILLPEHWQKVKWAVAVARKYELENTTDNALFLTEACLRTLAKHILTEGKPRKREQASIH